MGGVKGKLCETGGRYGGEESTALVGVTVGDTAWLYRPFEETTVIGLTGILGSGVVCTGLISMATGEFVELMSSLTSSDVNLSFSSRSGFFSLGCTGSSCSGKLPLSAGGCAEVSFTALFFDRISFNLGAFEARLEPHGGLFKVSKDFDVMAGKESSDNSGTTFEATDFSSLSDTAPCFSPFSTRVSLALLFSDVSVGNCRFSFLRLSCSLLFSFTGNSDASFTFFVLLLSSPDTTEVMDLPVEWCTSEFACLDCCCFFNISSAKAFLAPSSTVT